MSVGKVHVENVHFSEVRPGDMIIRFDVNDLGLVLACRRILPGRESIIELSTLHTDTVGRMWVYCSAWYGDGACTVIR